MIDLKLLEQFIIELSSPSSKIPIHNFFKSLNTEPVGLFVAGIPQVTYLMAQNSKEVNNYVHLMLFGVALTTASKNPDMANQLQGFLDYKKKERGENVVDFLQWNAGKGHA